MGAPASRPLRADAHRNRERLLAVAAATFAGKGIDAPLEDVARSAGVGIGTLYRHFPTRDALIEAVYRHEVEVLSTAAGDLLATLPPEAALAEWMQRFVAHVATKRGMSTALRAMMTNNAELFDDCRAQMVDAATRLLAAAVAAGSVRDDISGADLLRAVGGICMSTEGSDWPQQAQRLVGLLFDGLKHWVDTPG